jgi:uncharacterized protein (TIGR02246 family)
MEPYRLSPTPVVPILLGGLLWAGSGPCSGQQPARGGPGGIEDVASLASAQERELRAFNASFVEAYNRGDIEALASMYAEDAEVFESDGARYRGREIIEQSYAELFKAEPGGRLELSPRELRLLSPEVAMEEGRSVVSPAVGPPSSRLYTSLFVRRDGRWLLASVREEDDPLVPPRERLRELEWMIGEWIDEGPESETRVDCRWSADGHFLLREFSVRQAGEVVMSVSQRVGWDPVAGSFRSWEFDSEGGFGEGKWFRDGDRWVVSEAGLRPEGVPASSTRILEKLGPDQVRWTRLDLRVDGELVPLQERSVLTRVPPAPDLGDEAWTPLPRSTSTNSPSNLAPERNPR